MEAIYRGRRLRDIPQHVAACECRAGLRKRLELAQLAFWPVSDRALQRRARDEHEHLSGVVKPGFASSERSHDDVVARARQTLERLAAELPPARVRAVVDQPRLRPEPCLDA